MSDDIYSRDDVLTIYGRKQLRPELDVSTRPLESNIPEMVTFAMPDGSLMAVNTRQEIIIGRRPRDEDPPVTINLEEFDGRASGVSRHHAMIKSFKGALMLVDLDSINGTFINGRRALPLKRYALIDQDEITVGKLTIKLLYP